jgi:hypothetical protein
MFEGRHRCVEIRERFLKKIRDLVRFSIKNIKKKNQNGVVFQLMQPVNRLKDKK